MIKIDNGGAQITVNQADFVIQADWKKILNKIDEDSSVTAAMYSVDSGILAGISKKARKVNLIVNEEAEELKVKFKTCSNIQIEKNEKIHSKILLVSPSYVYVGSQGLCNSSLFEAGVFLDDKNVYDFYLKQINNPSSTWNIRHTNKRWVSGKNPISSSNCINFDNCCVKNRIIKFATEVNWNQKFNGDHNRKIRIFTHTLPDKGYIEMMIEKLLNQGNEVEIVANSIVKDRLIELKKDFSQIQVGITPDIHAKLILVDDVITWISSQNFGTSSWFENTLNIKNKTVNKFYTDEVNKLEIEYL